MLKRLNPEGIAPPFSNYSLGVEAGAGARWLHISGQVGVRPDGTLASGAQAQMEQAWDNLLAICAAAGMGPADLVKVTVYLTNPADVGLSRQVRDQRLDGHAPASTLAIVAGLAHPDWVFEVEAVAAAR